MKTTWQNRTLGELCSFIGDGNWIESKDQSSSGIRLVQTGNIGNGQFLNKAERSHFVSEQTFSDLRCEEIFPGDVLISRLPEPIGRSCIVPDLQQRMITAVDCTIARFDKKQCSKKYFVYFSQSHQYLTTIKQYCTGTTRSRISRKNLEKIRIPIPLLSEQERIVGILDAAFEKIDKIQRNAERNLENAKELFQQVLDEEMTPKEGWKKTTIGNLCSKIGSGATPKGGKSSYCENGISLIRSLNVHYNEFKYKDLAHINNEQAKLLDGVTIIENDILFNITGASIARCCIVPSNVIPARVNQHVMILRLKNSPVLHQFLVFYLIASPAQKKLLSIGEDGSTRQALTKTDMSEFEVLFPDYSQQERIVNVLMSISQKSNLLSEKMVQIQSQSIELKQQILAKAFNGEL